MSTGPYIKDGKVIQRLMATVFECRPWRYEQASVSRVEFGADGDPWVPTTTVTPAVGSPIEIPVPVWLFTTPTSQWKKHSAAEWVYHPHRKQWRWNKSSRGYGVTFRPAGDGFVALHIEFEKRMLVVHGDDLPKYGWLAEANRCEWLRELRSGHPQNPC